MQIVAAAANRRTGGCRWNRWQTYGSMCSVYIKFTKVLVGTRIYVYMHVPFYGIPIDRRTFVESEMQIRN